MNPWLIAEFIALGFVSLLVGFILLALLAMLFHTPLEMAYESLRANGPRYIILKTLKASAVIVVILGLSYGTGWALFEYTSNTPKAVNQTLVESLVVQ